VRPAPRSLVHYNTTSAVPQYDVLMYRHALSKVTSTLFRPTLPEVCNLREG